MNLRSLIVLAGVVLMVSNIAVGAEKYPTEPIRLIMPYTPGGGADTLGRLVASKVAGTLPQPIVVENKPGANTMIATDYVAGQKADGYTLLYSSSALTINPFLYKPRYDAEKSFKPVALLAEIPLIMVTSADSPIKSINDVLETARKNPGRLSFGSYGLGSAAHLGGALFESLAHVKLLHVPFKGSAPALSAVMGKHIDIAIVSLESALAMVKGGNLRALGIFSPERLSSLPDTPAINEVVPGCVAVGWNGILAPAGTPDAIVSVLNKAINETFTTPELKHYFANQGVPPASHTPEEFAQAIHAETQKWGRLVKEANIKIN